MINPTGRGSRKGYEDFRSQSFEFDTCRVKVDGVYLHCRKLTPGHRIEISHIDNGLFSCEFYPMSEDLSILIEKMASTFAEERDIGEYANKTTSGGGDSLKTVEMAPLHVCTHVARVLAARVLIPFLRDSISDEESNSPSGIAELMRRVDEPKLNIMAIPLSMSTFSASNAWASSMFEIKQNWAILDINQTELGEYSPKSSGESSKAASTTTSATETKPVGNLSVFLPLQHHYMRKLRDQYFLCILCCC